jgi:hypothetical protein
VVVLIPAARAITTSATHRAIGRDMRPGTLATSIAPIRGTSVHRITEGGGVLTAMSERTLAAWAAGVVLGLAAVALSSGSAKAVAGIAAAVAATNALIEVWRANRVLRSPVPADESWWRLRELAAKGRARLWTLLAGGLTLAALARDDGAGPWQGVAITAGVIGVALGAVVIIAVSDERVQDERMPGFLGSRFSELAGVLLVAGSAAALIYGSW